MNPNRIKEHVGGSPLDYGNYNAMVRAVNMLLGLEFSDEFNVSQGNDGVKVSLGEISGDAFPWDKVALGYELNPNAEPYKMLVMAGKIDGFAVAKTDPALTVANDDYVYVRRTITDDTMVVQAGATDPANDETYRYYRLYRVSVDGVGTVTMQNIYRPFDIEGWEQEVPSGGTQYQVLQRDGEGNAVWDWVRWP